MVEDELVIRAKSDRAAFGRLYDAYHPGVTRYCLRRLLDHTVAEDVVADVFLTAAENITDFPGRTDHDVRCWLFRLATNAVNAFLRQARRRKTLLEDAARGGRWSESGQANRTPGAWDMLDWPAVYQAILDLDERDQSIVMLRFFADLSHEEIAKVLGCSAGAARMALSRVLGRLRERFTPPAAPKDAPSTSAKDKVS
jgi:RNA polymerase sigma-70 factor (ECF subfamily)